MTQDMSAQGVLSSNGICKTFDAAADGYGRAEGVNAIMVKLLDDALRDGDPIRAVIRSTAVNSDGRTSQVGAPSAESQQNLIRHAYKMAGIQDFSETAFVECHGTGTLVGDPVEVAAIGGVFGCAETYIGSVSCLALFIHVIILTHSLRSNPMSVILKARLESQESLKRCWHWKTKSSLPT